MSEHAEADPLSLVSQRLREMDVDNYNVQREASRQSVTAEFPLFDFTVSVHDETFAEHGPEMAIHMFEEMVLTNIRRYYASGRVA